MTLNAKIGGFMDFFAISSCNKSISFTRRCHGSNIICTSVWLQ